MSGWLSPSLSCASLTDGIDGYAAIHTLLVWYLRITNDLKELTLTSSLVRHEHFSYMYRSIGDTSLFLLTDWAGRYVNNRNYHVPFIETLETYSLPQDTFTIEYQDEQIICQQDYDKCDFLIHRITNLIYNHILEPIGTYNPTSQQLHFYVNAKPMNKCVVPVIIPHLQECVS